MNRDRLWTLSWLIAVAAVVFLGGFLGVGPQAEAAKVAAAESVAVKAQNLAHELALQQLKSEFANIDRLKADLATVQTGVPLAANIPSLLNQIDATANQSGVTVDQIVISDGTGYVPAAAAADVDADAEDATADAAPTATNDTGLPAAMQPNSKVTNATYVSVPITIEASGSAGAVLEFLSGLQHGDRIIAITSMSTDAGTNPERVALAIAGEVYVLLDESANADS